MKVCIAEKPSVAREIAQVIGAKSKKDGYYEGNGYQVTWTFGHFCQLREPEDYRPEWKRWSIHELPMVPDTFGIKLLQNKGVEQQFKVIKKLLEHATLVINCGDAGQEGEVIQRWVLTEAKFRKPFKRLWISSLTEEAIRQGFQNLKEGSEFDLLYQAGKSRAIGDWLLGINATRLFTIKYAQGRQLLSLGRVQTPTLAMIVNRYHEIQNFKPEPFWELKTIYRDTTFSSTNGKFLEEAKGRIILEAILPEELTITDIETKKGVESPPRLFDLTSLQIECNNKIGLSADETLKTVQSLYEKKVVTYPRVDTTFLPDDMYPKIPGILKGLTAYQALTAPLLQSKIRKSSKNFNNNKVTDHHAIIPTGASSGSLYGPEASVYDLIVRRFLAAFYPDCIVSNTTVTAEIAGHTFRAKGRQILEPGWRVIYEKEENLKKNSSENNTDDKEEENAILPVFVKGEHGPHQPLLDKKMTSPPKDYTEATLLRTMETAGRQIEDEELKEALKENGIGRPSTRAAIIETLYKREYIRKEKKKIVPTPMGIDLINLIKTPTLKSPELTGQWEKKLRQIESGSFSPDAFLAELKHLVLDMVQEVKSDRTVLTLEPKPTAAITKPAKKEEKKNKSKPDPEPHSSYGTCPACKSGHILKGSQAYGCSRWKEGCGFRLPVHYGGKTIPQKAVLALFKKGKTPVIKGLHLPGNSDKTDAILTLDENLTLQPQLADKKPLADPFAQCPKCKQGEILKGNSAYGCSRFRDGCSFLLPFVIASKTLTEKNITDLLTKGKTPKMKGFVSAKTGNKFEAILKVNEEGKVIFQFD
ncbi:type IA DNA topoisomerase [Adhaeribacter pallidiroseus]|uniref:DNA topoisomerase n=1 Tax=Adhaeribacter pallidiroseus TaxID=2072847 RepID=A0A369QHZ2_9BACT|nr:type IA DNA topoisomerase [Adhaeribacter pallidiroseus]RDC63920.1 DNA topoisomerase [Adhaeribacter pallidiroseus]